MMQGCGCHSTRQPPAKPNDALQEVRNDAPEEVRAETGRMDFDANATMMKKKAKTMLKQNMIMTIGMRRTMTMMTLMTVMMMKMMVMIP